MAKWPSIIVGIAALAGAVGVMDAAASAHAIADPLLKTASNFLIVNAAAVIALCAFAQTSRDRGFFLPAASLLLLGTWLFGGELTLHVLVTHKSLPLIAPLGGSLTILGWLIAAASGFASFRAGPR
jgi:uncharacterized membrane protein YgdD (TMEM256/DUF423 family)